jgi:hypothetical protein
MDQQTRRLVNLLHYRPVGIKGWEYDAYHDETLNRLFKAQPLPPLEPDDPTLLTATPPEPKTSSTDEQTVKSSPSHDNAQQRSDSDTDPVQTERIDWLPRGWPSAVPAPIDLTPESVTAFCDHLILVLNCVESEHEKAFLNEADYTEEFLAIELICEAKNLSEPVIPSYRDAAALLRAVRTLRNQPSKNQSESWTEALQCLTAAQLALVNAVKASEQGLTYDELINTEGAMLDVLNTPANARTIVARINKAWQKNSIPYHIGPDRRGGKLIISDKNVTDT